MNRKFSSPPYATVAFATMIACIALPSGRAMAAGPDPVIIEPTIAVTTLEPERPQWTVILGGGVLYSPEYEGSDEFDTTALPYITLSYGRWTLGPDRLRASFSSGEALSYDLYLGYGGGRDAGDSDSGYLDGLPDIDDSAILGGRIGYAFGDAEVYLALERYLGETDGTSATVGIRLERQATRRLSWSAGASATFSDDNYMQGYFGITPEQAASSGYAVYEAGSGLRRIDLTLAATYGFNENWFMRGEVGVGYLSGDASDSPLVYDDTQPSAAVFLGYRF